MNSTPPKFNPSITSEKCHSGPHIGSSSPKLSFFTGDYVKTQFFFPKPFATQSQHFSQTKTWYLPSFSKKKTIISCFFELAPPSHSPPPQQQKIITFPLQKKTPKSFLGPKKPSKQNSQAPKRSRVAHYDRQRPKEPGSATDFSETRGKFSHPKKSTDFGRMFFSPPEVPPVVHWKIFREFFSWYHK